jgi:hypothetical protein
MLRNVGELPDYRHHISEPGTVGSDGCDEHSGSVEDKYFLT